MHQVKETECEFGFPMAQREVLYAMALEVRCWEGRLWDTIYHARSLLGSIMGSTLQGRKTRRMETGNAELPCSHKVALANYSEELWRRDDPSEMEWGVWAFIPPHQPVTEYRQTSGRERKLGLNAKSNSRNEPLISLFTKHLHTSTEITEPLAIFHLGILYLLEVWFLLCLQNILCPTVVSAIVVVFISLNHRHENQKLLRKEIWFGPFSFKGSYYYGV